MAAFLYLQRSRLSLTPFPQAHDDYDGMLSKLFFLLNMESLIPADSDDEVKAVSVSDLAEGSDFY